MPLKRCGEDGKGWKYGDEGHCYTGKDAKKQAIKQGLAIHYRSGEPLHASDAWYECVSLALELQREEQSENE